MSVGSDKHLQYAMPEGYGVVRLGAKDQSVLGIGLVVRQTADAVEGPFVVVGNWSEAQGVLGCIVDHAGRVQEWVELWVQKGDAKRWKTLAEGLDRAGRLIKTGWEEGALGVVKMEGGAVFNAGGSGVLVRRHAGLGLETYLRTLTEGAADPGVVDVVRKTVDKAAVAPVSVGGWLFLGKAGKSARLLETLHLKLRVLADAVNGVSEQVRLTGRPMFDLSAGSFKVALGEAGSGLPRFWGARTVLMDPGGAVDVSPDGSATYFAATKRAESSVYLPGVAQTGLMRGRCAVRLRGRVGTEAIFEGTLTTQERLELGGHDLITLRMLVGGQEMTLYARGEKSAGLAAGEWRFRTTTVSAEATGKLNALAGVPMEDVAFEVLAGLSSPVDLYSLGVLAVRALLVNGKTTLPMALDAVGALAGHLAEGGKGTLSQQVAGVLGNQPALLAQLGPDRVVDDAISAQAALDLVPMEIWADVLACVLKMFAGKGAFSTCKDFGDAPAGGLHKVFGPAAAELDKLVSRTRSLIVIDWRGNREVHALVRGYLTGMSGQKERSNKEAAATASEAPSASRPSRPAAAMLKEKS